MRKKRRLPGVRDPLPPTSPSGMLRRICAQSPNLGAKLRTLTQTISRYAIRLNST